MKSLLKIVIAVLLVGTVALLSIVAFIFPWSRLEFSTEATFRRLICPVIPTSVTNIVVDGFDNQYSSDVTITFEIAPEDRESLLSAKPYEKVPCEDGIGECYRSSEQIGHGIFALYLATDSRRVWFNYWSS